MGIEVVPIPPGNDCIACFAAGETPSYMYVIFDGVEKGDVVGSQEPPNGRIFKCDQNAGDACLFEYNPAGPGWSAQINRSVVTGRWHVNLWHNGFNHFTGWLAGCPSEHDVWSNLLWSPIFFPGWNGVASVFWMETAIELFDAMHIPPDGQTLMEFFLKDESDPVYKFCNRLYGMNFTLLVTP